MCNCLTIGFPDTYTSHAMTTDMFLRYVLPGSRVPMPHTDLWPSGYIKVHKIPEKVTTFLFSTFNEVYHTNYMFEDGCRIAIGPHPETAKLKHIAKEISKLSIQDFCDEVQKVGNKVDLIWPGCKKILVWYDTRRADKKTQAMFIKYNEAIIKTVNWPVAQMVDTTCKKENWMHFDDMARFKLFDKIVEIEKT